MPTERRSTKGKVRTVYTIVVVKFRDDVELPYRKGAEEVIEECQIGPWKSLTKAFPGITLRPLFTAVEPGRIRELTERAAKMDPEYRKVNLLTYFYIYIPGSSEIDPVALAKALSAWPAVQTAYVDGPVPPPPAVNAANDPRSPNQSYLDPAPGGIDARYAWTFAGGDGAGVSFIDLEAGWTLNHEDLFAHGATVEHGNIYNAWRWHGTAVLGIVCAVDNDLGCVGIAPNVASVKVVSWNETSTGLNVDNVPNAIVAAIDNLVALGVIGNVLLLEAQAWAYYPQTNWYAPVEALDASYDAIRMATANGIVVVEAAGDGNIYRTDAINLDSYTNPSGIQAFNSGVRDSGAIIVAAASSTDPHTRMPYSNYGQRIDCYAWGENVTTLSSDSAGSTNLYTTNFDATSSASAIVAGAALAVQGIAAACLGFRFSPSDLRDILRQYGTDAPTEAIGVMPNLRAIIGNALNVAPDVYIRDFLGDTGDPHSGPISASPDIILRPSQVAPAMFGVGSGTENSATLGFTAEKGHQNFIYVRVLNRGCTDAANVQADVYWSPVATLVTPDLWTLVGTTVIPNVPSGDILTVSDPITWEDGDIPGPGHYCFVGLIGTNGDPIPGPSDFMDWNNFTTFIRDNNNVTWRNFNVVPNVPDGNPSAPKGWKALSFLAPGAPDKARRMHLEVIARLPSEARLLLEVPSYWTDLLRARSPFVKSDAKRNVDWIPIKPVGRHRLREIIFPAKSRTALRLLVYLPEARRKNSYEVAVRQVWKDQEVGRVTWRLAPPDERKQPDRPKPDKPNARQR